MINSSDTVSTTISITSDSNIDNECSICFENILNNGLLTNCGHKYCIICVDKLIKTYYESLNLFTYREDDTMNDKIDCPLCREKITKFLQTSSCTSVNTLINEYNIYSNKRDNYCTCIRLINTFLYFCIICTFLPVLIKIILHFTKNT